MRNLQLPGILVLVLAIFLLLAGQAAAVPILYGAAYAGPDGPAALTIIDPSTGSETLVGPIGFERVSAMAFHPVTGILYATGERSDGSNRHVLITIDPLTGAGTEIGPTGVESFIGMEP